jgi:hypothetical protein
LPLLSAELIAVVSLATKMVAVRMRAVWTTAVTV